MPDQNLPTNDGPSQPWDSGQAEYLDTSGSGTPVATRPSGRSRKKLGLLAGGVAAAALMVGGGAWAYLSFMAQGAQPAEALPAGTVAYASIDLDPSGGQKIEAITTLRKFPAFRDHVNLQAKDDLKRRFFDEIQGSDPCKNITYDADIKPWLGDRAAVAAVDLGGDTPEVALVLQVKDQGQAQAGLTKIENCGTTHDANQKGTGTPDAGWAFRDGWAVVTQTPQAAQQIVAATAKGSLADDATYKKWIGATGDPGIASFYVSPKVSTYATKLLSSFSPLGGIGAASSSGAAINPAAFTATGQCDPQQQLTDALKNFQGAAATLRFSDGSLELQGAMSSTTSMGGAQISSATVSDLIQKLPSDTGAAFGLAFSKGWFSQVLDHMSSSACASSSRAELDQQVQDLTGLTPADIDSLTEGGLVLSVGSELDAEKLANSGDPTSVPAALVLKGDASKAQALVTKLNQTLAGASGSELQLEQGGGRIAIGFDADYGKHVAAGGDLGSQDAFKKAVPDADRASSVFFLNFGANNNWLARAASQLSGGSADVRDNMVPLEAFGIEAYADGSTVNGKLRVSTH